jgi:endonuclease YncB( thermonuclease family)
MHGLKNTGEAALTYYMVKWTGKGVKAPEKPAGEPGGDLAAPPAKAPPTPRGQPKPDTDRKEGVDKLTGKVTVLDAHTLQFQDGTVVELNGAMNAPDLEQRALIGKSLYPCGEEAAEFLKKLVANQVVTCYYPGKSKDGKRDGRHCFVGERRIIEEMVRNGWATTNHTEMDGWEAIARDNKRGLWRGPFVAPEVWRLGVRLPEEPLPRGYQVDDQLCPFFVETKVTGTDSGKATSLVCAYEGKPVVMVYTWEINPAVIQLIKKLDKATAKNKDKRLASYVVLFCDSQHREKELKALAEKENIQQTLLTFVVVNKWTVRDEKTGPGLKQFLARFGRAAQTRIIMANGQKQVKASFAYRKGELTDAEIDKRLADLPKVPLGAGDELRGGSAQEPKARAMLKGGGPFVFRADGRMLVSTGIKLWDVASGRETANLQVPGKGFWSIATTSDGKTLASGYEDGTITIWDVATGKLRATFNGGRETIRAVAFSADGKTLVSGDEDGIVKVWDVATGKERAALEASASALRVGMVLFSPDDKVFASSSDPSPGEHPPPGEVRVWDTATLKELCTVKTGPTNVCVAIAPDGKTLASGNRRGDIKLWSVATGKELVSLTDHRYCQALAFSRDGKALLSASSAGTIKWWDVATGKEQGILKTHRAGPHLVFRAYAFSPDNKLLASVNSQSGEIELWDVPEAPR